jgi:hypothetical protein
VVKVAVVAYAALAGAGAVRVPVAAASRPAARASRPRRTAEMFLSEKRSFVMGNYA